MRYKYSQNLTEASEMTFAENEYQGIEQNGTMKRIPTTKVKQAINTELSGRLDTLEGTGAGSVAKAIGDLAGAGRTTETVKGNAEAISGHIEDTENPHKVTKTQVGLGNADDTSDANKPVSTAQQTALNLKEDKSNKVTAFQEEPTDTAYPSEKLVDTRFKVLEGTGEGSVAKAIDDALEPIDARVDSAELTIARQDQDLKSVKQTLQQGNGATLDFEDIGIVPLDARATGRANPTVKGRTATNIVDGAGILAGGTVTFASVLNHKYFDVLHGTILTGTGSDIVITNDTGATKNMAVIYLTGVYGSGNEPSASDCAKIFSYFDGMKSIQLPARIISESDDESESSTLYIADDSELRSVPAITDEVKVVNGELVKVQNVEKIPLNSSSQLWKYDNIRDSNTVACFYFLNNNVHDWIKGMRLAIYVNRIFSSADDSISPTGLIGKDRVFVSSSNNLNVFVTLTTLGTTYEAFNALSPNAKVALFIAWLDTQGLEMFFKVNNPIITPILTSGILQAKPKGTVYFEPYYEGSYQTNASSQITLPYEGTIDKLTGYDENLEPYEVPSTGYTLVGTLLTITGAEENEVFYVELSRSEPLAPEMSVNVLNNDQVTLDSVNGKYYKITFTTANGVPTTVATEVV